MCSLPDGSVHHKWICVMGRCESCPGYNIPNEEKETLANPLQIHFQTYKKMPKCSIHGILKQGLSTCPTCTASLQVEGAKTGKVTIRDRLTDMRTSIVTFHAEYYGPMLLKYKYHYGLVKMLSKNQCFEPRKILSRRLIVTSRQEGITPNNYQQSSTRKYSQITSDKVLRCPWKVAL